MNKSKFVIFAFFVHLCLVFGAKTVLASQKEEAQAHFKRGLAFTENEQYRYAAKEFEASIELHPTKSAYFNLAICYWNLLNECERALKTISRLKREFAGEIDADMKQDILAFEQEVKSGTTKVELQVNVDGAVIEVDGEEIGITPLDDAIVLRRGRHTIEASREGYVTEKRTVLLEDEYESKIIFALEKNPGQTGTSEEKIENSETAPVTEPTDETERKKLGLAPFIIAGGVSLAAGVATLVLSSQIDDKKESGDTKDAQDLQTAAKVTFGVAMAGVATTIVLAFFTKFKKSPEQPEVVSVNVITPIFTEQGGGVALRGSF